MMGYNNRQLATLDARLAVLCETIAGLHAGNSHGCNLPSVSALAGGRDAADHFQELLSAPVTGT
jgi:hypothetical protein